MTTPPTGQADHHNNARPDHTGPATQRYADIQKETVCQRHLQEGRISCAIRKADHQGNSGSLNDMEETALLGILPEKIHEPEVDAKLLEWYLQIFPHEDQVSKADFLSGVPYLKIIANLDPSIADLKKYGGKLISAELLSTDVASDLIAALSRLNLRMDHLPENADFTGDIIVTLIRRMEDGDWNACTAVGHAIRNWAESQCSKNSHNTWDASKIEKGVENDSEGVTRLQGKDEEESINSSTQSTLAKETPAGARSSQNEFEIEGDYERGEDRQYELTEPSFKVAVRWLVRSVCARMPKLKQTYASTGWLQNNKDRIDGRDDAWSFVSTDLNLTWHNLDASLSESIYIPRAIINLLRISTLYRLMSLSIFGSPGYLARLDAGGYAKFTGRWRENVIAMIEDDTPFYESIHSNLIEAFMVAESHDLTVASMVLSMRNNGWSMSVSPYDQQDGLCMWAHTFLESRGCIIPNIDDIDDFIDGKHLVTLARHLSRTTAETVPSPLHPWVELNDIMSGMKLEISFDGQEMANVVDNCKRAGTIISACARGVLAQLVRFGMQHLEREASDALELPKRSDGCSLNSREEQDEHCGKLVGHSSTKAAGEALKSVTKTRLSTSIKTYVLTSRKESDASSLHAAAPTKDNIKGAFSHLGKETDISETGPNLNQGGCVEASTSAAVLSKSITRRQKTLHKKANPPEMRNDKLVDLPVAGNILQYNSEPATGVASECVTFPNNVPFKPDTLPPPDTPPCNHETQPQSQSEPPQSAVHENSGHSGESGCAFRTSRNSHTGAQSSKAAATEQHEIPSESYGVIIPATPAAGSLPLTHDSFEQQKLTSEVHSTITSFAASYLAKGSHANIQSASNALPSANPSDPHRSARKWLRDSQGTSCRNSAGIDLKDPSYRYSEETNVPRSFCAPPRSRDTHSQRVLHNEQNEDLGLHDMPVSKLWPETRLIDSPRHKLRANTGDAELRAVLPTLEGYSNINISTGHVKPASRDSILPPKKQAVTKHVPLPALSTAKIITVTSSQSLRGNGKLINPKNSSFEEMYESAPDSRYGSAAHDSPPTTALASKDIDFAGAQTRSVCYDNIIPPVKRPPTRKRLTSADSQLRGVEIDDLSSSDRQIGSPMALELGETGEGTKHSDSRSPKWSHPEVSPTREAATVEDEAWETDSDDNGDPDPLHKQDAAPAIDEDEGWVTDEENSAQVKPYRKTPLSANVIRIRSHPSPLPVPADDTLPPMSQQPYHTSTDSVGNRSGDTKVVEVLSKPSAAHATKISLPQIAPAAEIEATTPDHTESSVRKNGMRRGAVGLRSYPLAETDDDNESGKAETARIDVNRVDGSRAASVRTNTSSPKSRRQSASSTRNVHQLETHTPSPQEGAHVSQHAGVKSTPLKRIDDTASEGGSGLSPMVHDSHIPRRTPHRRLTKPSIPPKAIKKEPSNRVLIKNALVQVCLAGAVNQTVQLEALEVLGATKSPHFLILFRDLRTHAYAGLYVYSDAHTATKIHGANVPDTLHASGIDTFYKYDCGKRTFSAVHTREYGWSVHAVACSQRWRAK
ncbi:hypothetical protein DFS34DRAFT_330209 [Phlyctochytrium arcticum]|nr:hypothetical protein DFS34DRAFT_330209 [Phlyctochytrium arcticum]